MATAAGRGRQLHGGAAEGVEDDGHDAPVAAELSKAKAGALLTIRRNRSCIAAFPKFTRLELFKMTRGEKL